MNLQKTSSDESEFPITANPNNLMNESEFPITSNPNNLITLLHYLQLYRFTTPSDKLVLVLAVVLSAVSGIFSAVCSYQVGFVTGAIVDYLYEKNNTQDLSILDEQLEDALGNYFTISMIGGAVILVCTFLTTIIFGNVALRQTHVIKRKFLSSLLNQDISWFDVNQTGDFASRMTEDLNRIEDGIGYKVSLLLFVIFSLITNVILALIMSWKLSLICLVLFPVQTLLVGVVDWVSSKLSADELNAYANAGAVAEETLGAVRTVYAFEGQRKEHERYYNLLKIAAKNNIKRAFFNGISNGLSWFMGYSIIGFTLWIGIKFILNDRNQPSELLENDTSRLITIIFSMINGLWFFLMLAPPIIQSFAGAKAGAMKIFAVIDSKGIINNFKLVGDVPNTFKGSIEFKDVHFSYPYRKKVEVLNGLTFKVEAGETVALVGKSGCGKSTCVQLIQRFYDTDHGTVFIDEKNVTQFNLSWLRNRIGIVEQEPVLFDTTIAENIKLGAKNVLATDVTEAAKKANAHEFIQSLPDGYETVVGERGIQLSGGQKQRVAIARALVRKPSILLLDEATSSLDVKSELLVQTAIDQIRHGLTTVIIAHRLSTIRKSDKIVVIEQGQVVEEGNHQSLMEMKGEYYKLVTSQVSTGEEALIEVEHSEDYKNLMLEPKLKPETVVTGEATRTSILKFLKLGVPEAWITLLGSTNAVVNALCFCLISVLYGKFVGILQSGDLDYLASSNDTYVLYFIYVSVVSAIVTILQFFMLGISGEKLILRIRSRMFKAVLSQRVAWFDKEENSVGALCVSLSSDAATVQQVTSQCFGYFLYMFATFVFAIIISFYFQWQVTLATLALYPALFLSIALEQKIISDDSDKLHKTLRKTTKIAVEAISNIRTVVSLNCENTFLQKYLNMLNYHEKQVKKNVFFRGIVQAISCNLIVFCYAVGLYYGGILVLHQQVDFVYVFITTDLLAITSWSLAHSATSLIDFEKGFKAAQRIVGLLNETIESQPGKNVDIFSDITYDNVHFAYPERPTSSILNGFDLSILHGKVVALVGPSGCGKSTVTKLLQRFYDANQGSIAIGGDNLKSLSVSSLRFRLGVVSQEPTLFSKTIRENIAYGDNTREVTDEEVVQAALQANVHNFITSLPLGYETKLGERGMQLSGGQKQRIAIARALIRNPKILILDEATSALDAESEKIVQKALDDAKAGRTCIIIAHRLSTIEDADVICVLHKGKVSEIGTHAELLRLKGIYSQLHNLR